MVQSTVRAFEGAFGNGWDMTESLGYFPQDRARRRGLPVPGDRRRGHVQAQPGAACEVRERVRDSFGQSACTCRRETAGLMSRLP